MRTEQRAWLLVLGGLALATAACPGTLDDKQSFVAYAAQHPDAAQEGEGGTDSDGGAGPAPPTAGTAGTGVVDADPNGCGDVVTRIFTPTCGGTGCHSATASQQGLDLVTPPVASRLVGISGTTCLETLVDPTQPENSLLYRKLLPKPPCGAQMPLARPPLSSADLACVRDWIAAQ
jgi:hypothetical protein